MASMTHRDDGGTLSVIGGPNGNEFIVACTKGHGWFVSGEPFEPEVPGVAPTKRILTQVRMDRFHPALVEALGRTPMKESRHGS